MRRRHVLGGLLVAALALAAVTLADVLATVFLTVTVAYLLAPVRRWLLGRGLSRWTASLTATILAFVGAFVAVAPLLLVVGLRLDAVIRAVAATPDSVTLDAFGFT